jgi:hypothetical protein
MDAGFERRHRAEWLALGDPVDSLTNLIDW